MADYAWAPLFAVLTDHHMKLVPKDVFAKLTKFQGEHTFTSSTFYPPFDTVPRNISSWLSEKLTIGAESFDEISLGGPGQNQGAFNPAVVQWDTGNEIAFISVRALIQSNYVIQLLIVLLQLYPTETALQTRVSPNKLSLTYPKGTNSSIFSLLVGTFTAKRTVSSWADVQGLKVLVSGNVNPNYTLSFAGHYGGTSKPIRDFEFWNFTYTMPTGFTGTPSITLDLSLD